MMRQRISGGCFLLVFLLAGCATESTPAPEAVVVCWFETPGFAYHEGDALVGYEPTLLRAWATGTDRELEFTKVVDFSELFSKTEAGECGVVAGTVTITEKRQQSYDFSVGYFDNLVALIAPPEFPMLHDSDPAEILAGRQIAAFSGTTYEDILRAIVEEQQTREIQALEIVYPPGNSGNDEELLEMVAAGEVEAAPLDTGLALFLLQRDDFRHFRPAGFMSENQEFGFMMPKGSPLKSSLDGFLGSMSEADRQAILSEHFDAELAAIFAPGDDPS